MHGTSASSIKFRTPEQCTHVASIGLFLSSVLMLAATPLGISFVLYEAILVVMLACKGLCFTSSVALAMNEKHNNAGAASALVGAIIFIFGGIVSPLVGMGDIILYTSITFVACASCSLSPAICGAPLISHIIFWHCGFFCVNLHRTSLSLVQRPSRLGNHTRPGCMAFILQNDNSKSHKTWN